MSTLAAVGRNALGLSSISRGYAITFADLASSLTERLIATFHGAITFAAYTRSISELKTEISAALDSDNHSADVKDRLLAAVGPALAFLISRPLGAPEPVVDVWDSGKIGFEWYLGRGRIVDATIDGNRRLVFSAMVGQERRGGVFFVDGEWPIQLVQAINEIRR